MQRTIAGISQTQWCTQVTGLIRHPRTPVRASPAYTSSRERRTRQAQTINTARTQTIQMYDATPSTGSRAMSPRNDWFDTYDRTPTRPVSHSADVQNSRDWSGKIAAATRVAPAAVPIAVSAARHRPVTSR